MKHGRLVDDLHAPMPRPRTTDSLATPEAVRLKHVLLAHLGLEEETATRAQDSGIPAARP
jgi:hypothetical protein